MSEFWTCEPEVIHKPTKAEFKRMAAQLGYEPVRHGHWISVGKGFDWHYECSQCGYVDGYPFDDRHKRCPYCGAKMDEVGK